MREGCGDRTSRCDFLHEGKGSLEGNLWEIDVSGRQLALRDRPGLAADTSVQTQSATKGKGATTDVEGMVPPQ
jgi:hypothetical protein